MCISNKLSFEEIVSTTAYMMVLPRQCGHTRLQALDHSRSITHYVATQNAQDQWPEGTILGTQVQCNATKTLTYMCHGTCQRCVQAHGLWY